MEAKLKWSRVSSWHANLRITATKLPSGERLEIHQARAYVSGEYVMTTTGVLRNKRGKLTDRVPFKGAGLPEARKRLTALMERRAA